MRLIDTDKLKFPNIVVFDMKLHGATVPMVRLVDLKELVPTVDAEPVRHGFWKEHTVCGIKETTIDEIQSARCSNCGKVNTTPYMYRFDNFNYCPNCGATMYTEE